MPGNRVAVARPVEDARRTVGTSSAMFFDRTTAMSSSPSRGSAPRASSMSNCSRPKLTMSTAMPSVSMRSPSRSISKREIVGRGVGERAEQVGGGAERRLHRLRGFHDRRVVAGARHDGEAGARRRPSAGRRSSISPRSNVHRYARRSSSRRARAARGARRGSARAGSPFRRGRAAPGCRCRAARSRPPRRCRRRRPRRRGRSAAASASRSSKVRSPSK